jgi:dTDP-4-dehydrorhamnose reductase
MKTAVIGASGYIGGHLWRSYRSVYPDCVGTTFSTDNPSLVRFDIRQPNLDVLRLEETGHEAVLIAAAKPNIAYCEQYRDAAFQTNVKGMLELARQIGRTRMQVIFLSSDYVFEGKAGPHDDDHEVRPTTEYGRQKAEVERQLPFLAAKYLVLRLSKVYGVQKGDRTLLDEMAGLLAAGKEVRAARDQVFCPTYVGDLIPVAHAIQNRGWVGTVNLCNPERWTRYDVAFALAQAMQVDHSLVRSISLHDIPGMAGRPLDTSMMSSRLARELQPHFTPLQRHIDCTARLWSEPNR